MLQHCNQFQHFYIVNIFYILSTNTLHAIFYQIDANIKTWRKQGSKHNCMFATTATPFSPVSILSLQTDSNSFRTLLLESSLEPDHLSTSHLPLSIYTGSLWTTVLNLGLSSSPTKHSIISHPVTFLTSYQAMSLLAPSALPRLASLSPPHSASPPWGPGPSAALHQDSGIPSPPTFDRQIHLKKC